VTTAGAPFWVDAAGDVPGERQWLRWLPWIILAVLIAGDAVLYSWLSVARHLAFQSHAYDLGHMDQAVWNTLHGRLFWFTDMPAGGRVLTSRLAIHVEPLLLPIAALYLLHGGPETLLVLQAVVVALGALPAYLLARSMMGRPWLSLVFPAAFLLHPSLQNAVLDDFHAVTLSATFLMLALLFLFRGATFPFAVSAALAAATKEEVGLLVAMMGLYLLIRRRWYAGFMAVACGLGWFLVCTLWIIPAANPSGRSPYLARYAYLGHGMLGVILSPLRHPGLVARTLTSTPRLDYLTYLLHPLGYVPLVGLPVLLLALPSLAINELSADPRMYSGFYQYSTELIPFIVAAAAIGVAACARTAGRGGPPRMLAPALAAIVLVASLFDSWQFGFSPLARGYAIPSAGRHQALERRLLGLIPQAAVAAAADEIQPHLSDRRWIYTLPVTHPTNGPPAQYVALDASIPSEPVEPHTLHSLALRLLANGYGVAAASDGILILRRGARNGRLPASFFNFAVPANPSYAPLHAGWAQLRLLGIRVHPSYGFVNRSRPAIEVETYWRVGSPLSTSARVEFALSPVYGGRHPAWSSGWHVDRDSPTLDWLPLHRWARDRTVLVASLPLVPPPYTQGRVDVAVVAEGLGGVSVDRGRRVAGNARAARVATIDVNG